MEISRARDRAELVTDDRAMLRERLEGATGERIAALEAVGREKITTREAPPQAARSVDPTTKAPERREREPPPTPEMEKARAPKRIEHDLGL